MISCGNLSHCNPWTSSFPFMISNINFNLIRLKIDDRFLYSSFSYPGSTSDTNNHIYEVKEGKQNYYKLWDKILVVIKMYRIVGRLGSDILGEKLAGQKLAEVAQLPNGTLNGRITDLWEGVPCITSTSAMMMGLEQQMVNRVSHQRKLGVDQRRAGAI